MVARIPSPTPIELLVIRIGVVPIPNLATVKGAEKTSPLPVKPAVLKFPIRDSFISTKPGPVVNCELTPKQPMVREQKFRSTFPASDGADAVTSVGSKFKKMSKELMADALVTCTLTWKAPPLGAVLTVGDNERMVFGGETIGSLVAQQEFGARSVGSRKVPIMVP